MSTPDAKAKILDAASALFLKGGAAALSVRAIAARAEISTIGIYSHFNGKQGLLDALYSEGFERVFDTIVLPTKRTGARKAILKTVSAYIDVATNFAAHYRLIFGEGDASYTPSKSAQEVGAKAFHRLTDLVSHVVPEKATGRQKQAAALQLWALVHGYVSLRNHPVADLIEIRNWKPVVMAAVTAHLDAVTGNENQNRSSRRSR